MVISDLYMNAKGFPGNSDSKESAHNAGDQGLIPGSGRSPGEGNGNPLQYSCLENPMDRGAWQATVHGVSRVGHNWVTNTHIHTWMLREWLRNIIMSAVAIWPSNMTDSNHHLLTFFQENLERKFGGCGGNIPIVPTADSKTEYQVHPRKILCNLV